MAFSFTGVKVYTLTSVGIEKNESFPVADVLKGIFNKVGRRPSSIKLLEYLILHERMCDNFVVKEMDVLDFCRLGSNANRIFDDLIASNCIECSGARITIRYDNILKE